MINIYCFNLLNSFQLHETQDVKTFHLAKENTQTVHLALPKYVHVHNEQNYSIGMLKIEWKIWTRVHNEQNYSIGMLKIEWKIWTRVLTF